VPAHSRHPADLVDGRRTQGAITRIAVVMDVRSRAFSSDLRAVIRDLAERGLSPHVLFLEARDEVLVRRFESVRRAHPLQGDGRLIDGITAERILLEGLRGEADLVVDTSDRSIHQLRAEIERAFALGGDMEGRPLLRATIVSFGYKYGLPVDADLVVDVRFLPNPFWIPELREQTGEAGEQQVADRVPGQRAGAAEAVLQRLGPQRVVRVGAGQGGQCHAQVTGRQHAELAADAA